MLLSQNTRVITNIIVFVSKPRHLPDPWFTCHMTYTTSLCFYKIGQLFLKNIILKDIFLSVLNLIEISEHVVFTLYVQSIKSIVLEIFNSAKSNGVLS